MGRPAAMISKEDILRAMKNTRSNKGASRYLNVSVITYRKYAELYKDEETGKTLWDLHKNQAGKGIPKYGKLAKDAIPLKDLLEGRVPTEYLDPQKVKYRIIQECLIEEKCNKCGFSERRVVDTKVPIILNHIDGNRRNWHYDNLEFLCYNCAFLYAKSPISDEQVVKMEHFVESKDEFDWEMDEHIIDHLKDLGLHQDEEKPGEEYISRL